jgi:hypothetical protein
LRRQGDDWVVSIPLYALEFALAPPSSSSVLNNLSETPWSTRSQAIAEELETAALALPRPEPGTTGFAPVYFPAVFDLIGGCAKPFFRSFLSSPSPELRAAAQRWLTLVEDKKLTCGNEIKENPH